MLTAREQAKTTAEMFVFSRKLAGIRKLDTLMAATATQVANMLKVDAGDAGVPQPGSAELKQMASAPSASAIDSADMAAAAWCWDKNQPTGRGTDTLPGARRLFMPLRTGQGKVAVIGVSRDAPNFLLTPQERRPARCVAGRSCRGGYRAHSPRQGCRSGPHDWPRPRSCAPHC